MPDGILATDESIIHLVAESCASVEAAHKVVAAAVCNAEKIRDYGVGAGRGACAFASLAVETFGRQHEPVM
jgi:hypothetical protein